MPTVQMCMQLDARTSPCEGGIPADDAISWLWSDLSKRVNLDSKDSLQRSLEKHAYAISRV